MFITFTATCVPPSSFAEVLVEFCSADEENKNEQKRYNINGSIKWQKDITDKRRC